MKFFFKQINEKNFLKEGFIWGIGTSFLNFIFVILLNFILVQIMGLNKFGEFVIVQGTVLTIASVCQISIGYTISNLTAKYALLDPKKTEKIIGLFEIIIIIMGLLGFVLTISFGKFLANEWLQKPEIANYLIYASGAVFFQVIIGFQIGLLVGLKSFKNLSIALGIGSIFVFISTVVLAILGGIELASLGLTIGYALQWLALYAALRRTLRKLGIKTTITNVFTELPSIIHFWMPAALAGLISAPFAWLAGSFLMRQTDGLAQIAIFYSVDRLRAGLLVLPQIINRVSLTFMNEISNNKSNIIFNKFFRDTFLLSLVIAVIGVLVIALIGNFYIEILGNKFDKATITLNIILVASFIEVLWQSIYLIIPARGSMWKSLFFLAIPRDITLVTFAWLLTPSFHANGLALAYVISWITASVFLYILIVKNKLLKSNLGNKF